MIGEFPRNDLDFPRENNSRIEFVESDCDHELLFNIPFTGHVRLTGLSIIGDEDGSHPAKIRLFKDREAVSHSVRMNIQCSHSFRCHSTTVPSNVTRKSI